MNFIDPYGPEARQMAQRVADNYLRYVSSDTSGWVDAPLLRASSPRPVAANPSGISPTEYKVLVLPKPVEEKSKGGIIMPLDKVEKDKFAMTEGRIIAIAPLAFTYASETEWDGNRPVVGDVVIYERYQGVHVKGPKDGVEYVLVNDKAIFATVETD